MNLILDMLSHHLPLIKNCMLVFILLLVCHGGTILVWFSAAPPTDNLDHSPGKTFWCPDGAAGIATGPLSRGVGGHLIKQPYHDIYKTVFVCMQSCLCVWHTRLEWFPGWVSHCFLPSVSLHHIIQWSYQIFQKCVFKRTRSTNFKRTMSRWSLCVSICHSLSWVYWLSFADYDCIFKPWDQISEENDMIWRG